MAVPVALSLSSNRKPLGLSGFTGRFRDDLDMPNSRNKFARVRHFFMRSCHRSQSGHTQVLTVLVLLHDYCRFALANFVLLALSSKADQSLLALQLLFGLQRGARKEHLNARW